MILFSSQPYRSTILQSALPETDFIEITQLTVYRVQVHFVGWRLQANPEQHLQASLTTTVHNSLPMCDNLEVLEPSRTIRHLLAR
ncbi:hypothetical protein QUB13_22440 [Microcoleus sp. B4-D4]